MVRHIVIWDMADGFSDTEKQENAEKIKEQLEGLQNVLDGIVEIKVVYPLLPSSNGDLILCSAFRDEAALAAYQSHPRHLQAAAFIQSVTTNKRCADYIEN